MNIDFFVDTGVLFGSFLAVIIVMGQLLLKKKNYKNYLLVGSFLCLGIYNFSISFNLFFPMNNWYTIFPFVYIAGMCAIYCSIPLAYLFFRSLPDSGYSMTKGKALHFAIPIAATLILIFFAGFPGNSGVSARYYIKFIYENDPVVRIIDTISVFLAIIYFTIAVLFYSKLSRKSKAESKRNLFIVLFFLLLILFFMSLYFGYYEHRGFFQNLFKLRFTLLLIYIFVASYRYPFVANIIKLEAYRDYYVKSHLEHIEPDTILDSLEHLMEEENLFTDSELTIKKTAERLEISSHQLSEILNTRLHKTFTNYIRNRRVKFARQLLVTRPVLSIIEISAECGFNAISNFNTSFKKATGMSPTEYRKKYGGGKIK